MSTETSVSSKLGALAANGDQNSSKTSKRDGNAGMWENKANKQSRRATSLLNLFMSNSHGMSSTSPILTFLSFSTSFFSNETLSRFHRNLVV